LRSAPSGGQRFGEGAQVQAVLEEVALAQQRWQAAWEGRSDRGVTVGEKFKQALPSRRCSQQIRIKGNRGGTRGGGATWAARGGQEGQVARGGPAGTATPRRGRN
jgi:hypothetical protein